MHAMILIVSIVAADPAPADSLTNRGEAVVAALNQKKYDVAATDFTPDMQKALSPDKLKSVWESILGQYGPFQKMLGKPHRDARQIRDRLRRLPIREEKLDIRLVYSADKKLGGLQFVPPKPAVEYKSPPYVHADKFKSRDMTVGAGTPGNCRARSTCRTAPAHFRPSC